MRHPVLLVGIICLAAVCLASCTAIGPGTRVPPPHPTPTFSHASFQSVLRDFVDLQGRVDYAELREHRVDLDAYLALLALHSPDSDPQLFPARGDELAYWINAYNASVIATVLQHYPISSVGDVAAPFPFSFLLPGKSGFFLFQRITLGGDATSLYALENSVVRKRFRDPRIHFALNCASISCPRLPRHVFLGNRLDAQLDEEARRFIGEARNVTIDPESRTVELSSIFDWYESDFVDWDPSASEGKKPSLRTYVARYLPSEQAEPLLQSAPYEIRFRPYDWGLNDQIAEAD